MNDNGDNTQTKNGRRIFYTASPNNTILSGGFSDLTGKQSLSLLAHIHLAKKQVKYLEMAFGPTYDAPSQTIARNSTTAARNNRVLIERGYVELVRQNRGKAPTFRLTPKLRDKLLCTITEIRADRNNKPRKRRIPDGLLKWQKQRKVETISLDRKGGHDPATNDGGKAEPQTTCLGSVETDCLGSGLCKVFGQKRDSKRDTEKKSKNAADRGTSPPVTPPPAREEIQAIICNGRLSEGNCGKVISFTIARCRELCGAPVRATKPFAYGEIRDVIERCRATSEDFLELVDQCALTAKDNPQALATLTDFFGLCEARPEPVGAVATRGKDQPIETD